MITQKKIFVICMSILLFIFVLNSLNNSKSVAIDQYLAEHEASIGAFYPVPFTDIRWSLIDVRESKNGLELSAVEKADILPSDGQNSIPKDSFSVVTVTLILSASDNGNPEYGEEFYLPVDFLRLANKADISSYSLLKGIGPSAFLSEAGQNTGNLIHVAPGETLHVKFAYTLDEKESMDNYFLYTSVSPSQSVSVCIQLKDYY